MIKKLILIGLVACSLFADLKEVDAKQLQIMIKKGVQVIDIRRLAEFKSVGIIKGAKTITFFDEKGNYDIASWMSKFTKVVKDKNQPFVLYCAHANRSKVVGKFLASQVGYKNVYELKGGIIYGWIDKGFKTVRFK